MKRIVAALAVYAALAFAGMALAAGWTELGSASAPAGQTAHVFSGQISLPQYFSVDLGGKNVSGSGSVECMDSAGDIATTVTDYSGIGYHALNLPYANPVWCQVFHATVFSYSNSSSITLWVYQ